MSPSNSLHREIEERAPSFPDSKTKKPFFLLRVSDKNQSTFKRKKKRSDFLNHKVEKFDLLLSDPFFLYLYENVRGKNGGSTGLKRKNGVNE
jgi:hypothetical protein